MNVYACNSTASEYTDWLMTELKETNQQHGRVLTLPVVNEIRQNIVSKQKIWITLMTAFT